MTENGKPKYFSLMEQLKADIVSGAICPGEKLPSENELSQKYSLSRHTVRKALGILEQDGYVEAFHGKGTFCSENMSHIRKSKSFMASQPIPFPTAPRSRVTPSDMVT